MMGLFSKKEKKLIQEIGKKNVNLCKEGILELEELYADLAQAYESISSIAEEYKEFTEKVVPQLADAEKPKMENFVQKVNKMEKTTRNAVRDVRDVLRNQKKRLKEAERGL